MDKNSKMDNSLLRDKIRQGLDLAFKKLIAKKRTNDEVFVFSRNGKIVEVKAVDYKG